MNRRRVSSIRILQGHRQHGARFHIDGVLGFVRQMCLTIFHLRDLGIRIIGMFPFFIGPLLRPFPIQLGQILLRRRLNPARFCQLREKLRVTFSRVPPNDGSHRRVGLQGRSVHANRLPIDQSVFRQYLQHPRKHSAMGLQIDQSPRSRYRRMIRCALRQRESQKALQAQRVGAAPGNPSFRVNAFEISDHQHPEIHSRRDARPTHRFALVKTNALLFGELINLFVLQNFIHPIVEDVPARWWQLSRRDPQWLLPRSFFTHRHRLSSPIATFFTDYGQCWSNYIEYSRLKSRLLPRAASACWTLAGQDSDHRLPDDIDGGDEKVLRSWFRDSNSLEDFRSGRDFQYGLCDVCDRDVERACQSVYQSFRRLIDHGEIRSGAHVRFRGTLIRVFEDVPLLDQQWIDAYTVVLAEWSALLLQQGYQLGNADPHQLACVIPLKTNGAELLTPSTSADRTEAARRRVTAMLAKFEARARTIDGRIYFHFDDYVRWKGRKAQCKAHYDGFVIASWNDWVEARGNGATAELDGIRVAKIAVRVPALVRCADSEEAARQQCRRADLIIGIVTQAYNNDRQIARWCEHFKKTIIEIYRIIFTIERIRRRYFGDPLLMKWNAEIMDALIEPIEKLVSLHNASYEQFAIDLAELQESVQPDVEHLVEQIVGSAKPTAVETTGDARRAGSLTAATTGPK